MHKIILKQKRQLGISLLLGLIVLFTSAQVQGQDVDFDPNISATFTASEVEALAIQDDGKIFITGNFNLVGGVSSGRIARLQSNGDLISSFNAILDNRVNTMAAQPDGKLIVGGRFREADGAAGFVRNRIARLNIDGSVDPDFNPNANGEIYTLLLQDDGKIVIGGAFTQVGGVARSKLARLNADGSVDTDFTGVPIGGGSVYELGLQDDGKLVIAGDFSSVDNEPRNAVARVNAVDGSLDTSFIDPQVNNSGRIFAMAIQDDGGIVIAGFLSSIGQYLVRNIARIGTDGSYDTGFINPLPNTSISTIALQDDGMIVIGGSFTQLGNRNANRLARLKANGSIDTSFDPNVLGNANGGVNTLLIQSDGKILVGGRFDHVGGYIRHNMARLNVDGSVEGVRDVCIPVQNTGGAVSVICL